MRVSFGAHYAELVSLRIGKDSPGLSAGLPDVGSARPEREQAVNFLIAVHGAAEHEPSPGAAANADLAIRIRVCGRSGPAAQPVEVSPSPLAWACLGWGLAERQCSVMAALETAAQPHHTEANPEMVSRAMMTTAMRLTMPKIATLR